MSGKHWQNTEVRRRKGEKQLLDHQSERRVKRCESRVPCSHRRDPGGARRAGNEGMKLRMAIRG